MQRESYDALRKVRRTPQKASSWSQPELVQQIYWLRAGIQHPDYAQLPRHYKAQIRCNLGNALSAAGRFVGALADWRMELHEQPNLGMGHGNLGEGLATYADTLYDGATRCCSSSTAGAPCRRRVLWRPARFGFSAY